MRRRGLPGRPLALALALAGAAALPLPGQVIPRPAPLTPERRVPQAPLGDLVITSVSVIQDGTGAIVAVLNLRNVGQAPVTIPRGTIIARGEAQSGSIAFPAQKVGEGFALHPGTQTSVSLRSTGWCPSGKPGAVTFRVNPDNAVPESDTRNNTFALPASAYTGELRPVLVWVESQRFPPSSVSGLIEPGQRNTLPRGAGANIVVSFENSGPGVLVVCAGAPLLRDVQSPVSAMFGLKTYNSPLDLIVRPGAGSTVKLASAVGPIVLEPGTYPWQWVLNPTGAIAELNAGNNAASATVRVVPQIQ